MEYTLNDKYDLIKNELLKTDLKDPIKIIKNIMKKDFINIHGPEHHFLDGAAFLTAYYNINKNIDLKDALEQSKDRTMKMPGAMCGLWGICGNVASLGASLSILHKTGPLSNDNYYKDHMLFTAKVLNKMSTIGGPRCCKRNAFITIQSAVEFVNEHYNSQMQIDKITCDYSKFNQQCLRNNCPFFK